MQMSKREEKLTSDQKLILVEFMESHPHFARNVVSGVNSKEKYKNLWAILATQLNSYGPSKSILKWKTAWKGMKIKLKKKVLAIKENKRRAIINDLEERILQIITDEAVCDVSDSEALLLENENQLLKLESSEPAANIENKVHAAPSNIISWEQRTENDVKADSVESSPFSINFASDVMPAPFTPRGYNRKNRIKPASKDLDEFKKIASQTVVEIKGLKKEMKVIGDNVNRLAEVQIQTNKLLERIAVALEHK